MKRALLGLLVGCLTLGATSVAIAGENATAGISLHVTKPTTKSACATFAYDEGSASPFETRAIPCGKNDVWEVWVVVCNASDSVGVAGAEFGIDYDAASGSGVDVGSWLLCADLQFQSDFWPNAGSGNLVTWEPTTNCQTQILNVANAPENAGYAVVGMFNVVTWSKDQMSVTPRPASGRMKVADCQAIEDDITDAMVARGGIANFCRGKRGYDYCRTGKLTDEEETTWGKIKTQYAN